MVDLQRQQPDLAHSNRYHHQSPFESLGQTGMKKSSYLSFRRLFEHVILDPLPLR